MHLPVSSNVDERESSQQLPEEEAPAEALPPYEGPRATPEERQQMLRDAKLHGLVVRVLKKKHVRAMDLEDVLQATLFAAHQAERLPGGGGKERDKYVQAIAGYQAASYHRKRSRSPELEPGVDPERVVARAADVVADRDLLEKVMQVPVGDLRTLHCLARKWLGEKLVDIAADEDIPYDRLRKRVDELEERIKARGVRLRKAGGLLALLLAVGFGGWQARPVPRMAFDEPSAVLLEPAVSTHVGRTEPMEWARVLRGEAFRACLDGQWQECLDGLDAARELDPDGDRDPVVVAARNDARMGDLPGLKPGDPLRAPVVRPYADRASR